jgi:hypothetical protein
MNKRYLHLQSLKSACEVQGSLATRLQELHLSQDQVRVLMVIYLWSIKLVHTMTEEISCLIDISAGFWIILLNRGFDIYRHKRLALRELETQLPVTDIQVVN